MRFNPKPESRVIRLYLTKHRNSQHLAWPAFLGVSSSLNPQTHPRNILLVGLLRVRKPSAGILPSSLLSLFFFPRFNLFFFFPLQDCPFCLWLCLWASSCLQRGDPAQGGMVTRTLYIYYHPGSVMVGSQIGSQISFLKIKSIFIIYNLLLGKI